MGLSLGQTHFVPGTSPVCPGDIPWVSQEQPDQKVYVYVPFSCLKFCRATLCLTTFSRIWGGGGGAQETCTTPHDRALQHLPFQLSKEVSRFELPLGSCRRTIVHEIYTYYIPQELESCGPGIDPFRAGGPKWLRPENGRKMAFGLTEKKTGKWVKMARNSIFELFSGHVFHFRGHFSHFPGHFSPISSGDAKIRFSAIFVPISGRRPEMDLYQVHGIPTQEYFSASPRQAIPN